MRFIQLDKLEIVGNIIKNFASCLVIRVDGIVVFNLGKQITTITNEFIAIITIRYHYHRSSSASFHPMTTFNF